ncbi:MAG: hypothetical protein GY795_24805 [Desulfobacterales bacterium]|nr:hypothetical protein [Desulfobacterales bacterium]
MEKLKGKVLIAAIMAVSIISLSFSANAQSPVKITEHRYGNHPNFSDEKYNDKYGYTPDDSEYIYMTTCPEEHYNNCTYKTPDEICQEEFGSNYHFCSKDEITDNGYSIDGKPVGFAVLVDDDTYNCDNWNLWNYNYYKKNYYYLIGMPNHNNGWYRGTCNYWASTIACCPDSGQNGQLCPEPYNDSDRRGQCDAAYSYHDEDGDGVKECYKCTRQDPICGQCDGVWENGKKVYWELFYE